MGDNTASHFIHPYGFYFFYLQIITRCYPKADDEVTMPADVVGVTTGAVDGEEDGSSPSIFGSVFGSVLIPFSDFICKLQKKKDKVMK